MTSRLMFQPPLVLDSNAGNAAKNFPISLRVYGSTSDMTELYRLRYRAFRSAGWIGETPDHEFLDRYDAMETTVAIGAFHNGDCIGSLRLAFGGSATRAGSMPCEEQFPVEVGALREANHHRLVEFSRMAVEPSLTNRSFRTTLYASLVRAGLILTTASGVDAAVIAVHRNVSPFYQAMCGFTVLGTSAFYAGIAEPTHFLALPFQTLDERRKRQNAFFAVSAEEIERARITLAAMRRQVAA
uniref:N-acyl amino acid synthase FeeM domain-containing protein n=1 Tax=Hyphomicrobium sp. LHD-15 TaxID=3072142 RepID=UPI00280E017F|nr:GNAT family N-acyltransferase [Hyphomicrobium sp. LHD-15]MDQ8698006.1 GNAT family N-acyltransferase [Hyphomicrobium sp. LHD-15]